MKPETDQAYWDVLIYAKHQEVRVNRVHACIVNHKTKQVITLETGCPWIGNKVKKSEEKTLKYGPLRWQLGYQVQQCSIIINMLGGWSKDLNETVHRLVGGRAKEVIGGMQKALLSVTLNIACTFT